jgi:hypothetical protein
MDCAARRLRNGGAIPLGFALATLWATAANADTDAHIFTGDAFELSGDIRLTAVDGERGWVEGGFGKLRSGSDGGWEVQPQLGNVSLVWKPQFTWSLGAVVVGAIQGGQRTEAGLSQAYLSFRPMRSGKIAFSARAGLMWPPVSLEHEGLDWHVKDSITPSAINSWIGEEVRPVAAEATATATFGLHKVRATAALMAANDTSGTLLTFRGWALHDRTTLAFNRQPLPPLEAPVAFYQAHYTHPLLDVGPSFARRPGYYAKLAWQPPAPIRFELFRYDNGADPQAANADNEWGWRTRFNDVGVVANLGAGIELKAQAMQGRTKMGFPDNGRRWIDNRFRAAYVLLTRPFGSYSATARIDAFGTRNHGSDVNSEYDEHGWSAMIAGKRDWRHFSGLVELLRVWSDNPSREHADLPFRQAQTQLQAELRTHW